jgi:hypothetical protein
MQRRVSYHYLDTATSILLSFEALLKAATTSQYLRTRTSVANIYTIVAATLNLDIAELYSY